MTRSVYVVGGAGVGKSTFMTELLGQLFYPLGSLEDLHQTPNSRGTVITLRGHRIGYEGVYLGVMRKEFPGSDGLDRVSGLPGEAWLKAGKHRHLRFIVGEGATLATRRFLHALDQETRLLLIYLKCSPEVLDHRIAARAAGQDPTFVQASRTRAENLATELFDAGTQVMTVDSGDPVAWRLAVETASMHLKVRSQLPPTRG